MFRNKMYFFLLLLSLTSCAQFELIDRSEVNRPSMSLNEGVEISAPSPLTQLKSINSQQVNSCSVCSH